jgi:DNA-binding HxlR family transcriptional regulator
MGRKANYSIFCLSRSFFFVSIVIYFVVGETTMRYSEQLCIRFQQAMEVLGKRWTGLIIKLLMERPLRFHELAERLEVVSDRMLSERLKELEYQGVIERRVFAEVPVRVEYSLTKKGRALAPVIETIEAWSSRWIDQEPVEL